MHHPQHLQVVSLGKCQISDGLQKGTLSHSRETYQGWVLPVSPKTCQEQGPRERHVWGKTHMIYRKLCVLKSCCCLKPGLNLAKFFSRCIVEWLACGSAVGFTCCASSVLWNAYHIIYLRDPYEGEKKVPWQNPLMKGSSFELFRPSPLLEVSDFLKFRH